SRRSSTNDQHRWWHRGQMPGIAMAGRQLGAWNREAPAHAAGTNDDFVSLKSQPALGFDSVRIGEARGAGPLVDADSHRIDLRAKSRMGAHIVDGRAHARKEARIIEHCLANADAVKT